MRRGVETSLETRRGSARGLFPAFESRQLTVPHPHSVARPSPHLYPFLPPLPYPQARLADWAENNQRIFGPGALGARGLSARPTTAPVPAPTAVYDNRSTQLLDVGVAGSLQWPSAKLEPDLRKEQRVRKARGNAPGTPASLLFCCAYLCITHTGWGNRADTLSVSVSVSAHQVPLDGVHRPYPEPRGADLHAGNWKEAPKQEPLPRAKSPPKQLREGLCAANKGRWEAQAAVGDGGKARCATLYRARERGISLAPFPLALFLLQSVSMSGE